MGAGDQHRTGRTDRIRAVRMSGSVFGAWAKGAIKRPVLPQKSDNIIQYFWEGQHKEMSKEPFWMGKATMAAAMFWRAQPATGMSERGGSGLA